MPGITDRFPGTLPAQYASRQLSRHDMIPTFPALGTWHRNPGTRNPLFCFQLLSVLPSCGLQARHAAFNAGFGEEGAFLEFTQYAGAFVLLFEAAERSVNRLVALYCYTDNWHADLDMMFVFISGFRRDVFPCASQNAQAVMSGHWTSLPLP